MSVISKSLGDRIVVWLTEKFELDQNVSVGFLRETKYVHSQRDKDTILVSTGDKELTPYALGGEVYMTAEVIDIYVTTIGGRRRFEDLVEKIKEAIIEHRKGDEVRRYAFVVLRRVRDFSDEARGVWKGIIEVEGRAVAG